MLKDLNLNGLECMLFYPYYQGEVISESELKDKYKELYKYLTNNRNKLTGRAYFDKSNKLWYELWNQRNDTYFNQVKNNNCRD